MSYMLSNNINSIYPQNILLCFDIYSLVLSLLVVLWYDNRQCYDLFQL